MNRARLSSRFILSLILFGEISSPLAFSADAATSIKPAALRAIGSIDKRFQSFNTEMLEVTGGRFWKPYKSSPAGAKPAPMSADLYQYRPPTDLSQRRLRKLAEALSPFYLRSAEHGRILHTSRTLTPLNPGRLPKALTVCSRASNGAELWISRAR